MTPANQCPSQISGQSGSQKFTQGSLEGPERKVRDPHVCPICLSKCRLYKFLMGHKFDAAERRSHTKFFHKSVCYVCKRVRCNEKNCHLKTLGKRSKLPTWWGPQLSGNSE